MNADEFHTKSMAFDRDDEYAPVMERLKALPLMRGLHGAIGLATESGEMLDAYKRAMMYGTELDRTNVIEEAGDVLWYLTLILDSVGSTLPEAMDKNVLKLSKRYPEKFTEHAAVDRDVVSERAVLEETRDQSDFPSGWGLVEDPTDPGLWVETEDFAGAKWGPYETRESAIHNAWAVKDARDARP